MSVFVLSTINQCSVICSLPFEHTPGDGKGEGSLVSQRVTVQLNNNERPPLKKKLIW